MIVKSGRPVLNSDSDIYLLNDLGQVSIQNFQHELVKYKCDYIYKTFGPMSGTALANTISNLFRFVSYLGCLYNGNEM